MAECTLRCRGRDSSGDVVGNVAAHGGGALEGGLVAAIAIRRFDGVVVGDMAGDTGSRRRRHVRSGQGKPGNAVIERRCVPTLRRMTYGTIRRRKHGPRGGVRRTIRLLPGC
jgi:hypothetical protein